MLLYKTGLFAKPVITGSSSEYRVFLRVFDTVCDGLRQLRSCCMLLLSNAFELFGGVSGSDSGAEG